MSRRLVTLLFVMLLSLGVALLLRNQTDSTEATQEPPTIYFVTGGSNDYWQTTIRGAEAAAEQTGAKLEVRTPESNEDVETQMQVLLALAQESLDGIALSPLDPERQTRLINRLSQRAPVVTFDSDAPLAMRMNYIGASNIAAGKQAAMLINEALPKGGKVALVAANLTKTNTLERKSGLEEALAEAAADYEIVDTLVDNGDAKTTTAQLEELLESNPDLAGLVGLNAQHGPILVETVTRLGREGSVKLVTFDDLPATLDAVEQGVIYGTIAQDPYHYGFEAVRTLVKLHTRSANQDPLPGALATVNIGTQAVRQDGVGEFRRVQEKLAGRSSAED